MKTVVSSAIMTLMCGITTCMLYREGDWYTIWLSAVTGAGVVFTLWDLMKYLDKRIIDVNKKLSRQRL